MLIVLEGVDMVHATFRFNYLEFRRQVSPYIWQLDQKIYRPFYERMLEIAKDIQPEQWILQDHGTIFDEDVNDLADQPSSIELGYWLLVFLSTFIEGTPVFHIKWQLLFYALDQVRWSTEQYLLLMEGNPLPLLLKPELRGTKFVASHHAPYWNNMVPTQSYKNGWLNLEEISNIKSHLKNSREAVLSLTDEQLMFYNESNFVGKSKKPALRTTLNQVLELLKSAEDDQLGLLTIIS